ncbi:MAG: IS256 family transposase [Candidatus Obscuribacterales bacterium]|nr:IS256 family transposase [Candidatus Obscuribacterales bacterium]
MLDPFIKEAYKNGDPKETILGEQGLLKQLTKALVERCLSGELDEHLGYDKNERAGEDNVNRRNGSSSKTLINEHGEQIPLDIPRDRLARFEPKLVKKHQTRLEGFDEKVIAMYARGMTVRDIQAQLKELYATEVSPTLISNVTDAVHEDVKAWQNRTLDQVYPIVWFDALVVKVRDNQRVINKSVYLALAVNAFGEKELLGIWISENEGAKFWLSILTELKNRGVQDIFIACVDGLTGMPEAIQSVFPKTWVQLCIVHMIRNSLKFVSWKDRKALVEDLKAIYRAATEGEAGVALDSFAKKWDSRYPSISKSWRSHWAQVIPMFAFPPEIRKVMYTTNAIESVNMTLRKVSRNHRIFPNDEAVLKVMFLAIHNIAKKWTLPIRSWCMAVQHFAIEFEGRLPQ